MLLIVVKKTKKFKITIKRGKNYFSEDYTQSFIRILGFWC